MIFVQNEKDYKGFESILKEIPSAKLHEALLFCDKGHKNVIFRNLGLNRKEKQKLKTKIAGKESILRFISKKSNRTSSRKKKLLQTGGFIGNQVFQNFIFSNEKYLIFLLFT